MLCRYRQVYLSKPRVTSRVLAYLQDIESEVRKWRNAIHVERDPRLRHSVYPVSISLCRGFARARNQDERLSADKGLLEGCSCTQ
jgi:hypothetical protein